MISALVFAALVAQDCRIAKPQFASDAMKKRAVRRADIGDLLRQADIKGDVVVDASVGPDGTVICVLVRAAHPMLQQEVAKALKLWKFEPLLVGGKTVAYTGRLQFFLCNISCGELGIRMTLLRE